MARYLALYLAMLIPSAALLAYGLATRSKLTWILGLTLVLIALLIIWAMHLQGTTTVLA